VIRRRTVKSSGAGQGPAVQYSAEAARGVCPECAMERAVTSNGRIVLQHRPCPGAGQPASGVFVGGVLVRCEGHPGPVCVDPSCRSGPHAPQDREPRPPGRVACKVPDLVCEAAKDDGIVCADDECDFETGMRKRPGSRV